MVDRISPSAEKRSLEQRVEVIEAELAKLRGMFQVAGGVPADGWRIAVEKYAGDEDILSIFAEAQKLREADRKRARQQKGAVRRTKK